MAQDGDVELLEPRVFVGLNAGVFAPGCAVFFVLGKGELGKARAHAAADFDEPPRLEMTQEIIKHLRVAASVAGVVVKKAIGALHRNGE